MENYLDGQLDHLNTIDQQKDRDCLPIKKKRRSNTADFAKRAANLCISISIPNKTTLPSAQASAAKLNILMQQQSININHNFSTTKGLFRKNNNSSLSKSYSNNELQEDGRKDFIKNLNHSHSSNTVKKVGKSSANHSKRKKSMALACFINPLKPKDKTDVSTNVSKPVMLEP